MGTRCDVSVVIPTRNRPASLLRTVTALHTEVTVHGLEGQVEIVVADDASQPAAASAIERGLAALGGESVLSFRLSPHEGAAAARNAGVERSRGSLLVFLDDDIVPTGDFLRSTIAVHREHPEVLVINANLRPLRDDIYSRFWFHHYDAVFNRPGDLYPVAMLASGNCSMKRRVLDLERPLFDASLPTREDFDLYLRLVRHGVQVYKSDRILAHNDCRQSLLAFVRQYAGYADGQRHLAAKHGAAVVAAAEATQAVRPNWRFAHLYLTLRLVRAALLLEAGARRHLKRWAPSPGRAH